MTRRARSLTQGRWRAIALSLLLHSGIVAGAVYGWFTWKHRPPPVTTLAIEASVVDERQLKGVAPAPKPEPPPPEPAPEPEPEPEPVPEEQGPPKPDPAELERKQEEERLAQEKLEQEKQAQEQERLEAEKQAAAKAAAEKAAAEKAAADKKALEKKKAEEAAAAKKAADEKARRAREAELQRILEAEERGNAIRNSDEANRWHAQIIARITRAWIRPPSAQPGVECIVLVGQVPGGEVTSVRVDSCSINDAALRDSVEAAVLRASPLPPPPNPALFERNLRLIFAPQ
ncbi:MAG TPA: cell envelope integrity protein TolA [Steroidobacteraceae bacterium]|nr:cell envelope integrity protein TolA [Steroidobacteraceae bacterium]